MPGPVASSAAMSGSSGVRRPASANICSESNARSRSSVVAGEMFVTGRPLTSLRIW